MLTFTEKDWNELIDLVKEHIGLCVKISSMLAHAEDMDEAEFDAFMGKFDATIKGAIDEMNDSEVESLTELCD